MQFLGELGPVVQQCFITGSVKAPLIEETAILTAASLCVSIIMPGSRDVLYGALYVVIRIVHIAAEVFSQVCGQDKKLEIETAELILRLKEIRSLEELNEEDFMGLKRSLEGSQNLLEQVQRTLAVVAEKFGKKAGDFTLADFQNQIQAEILCNKIAAERQLSASIRARCARIEETQDATLDISAKKTDQPLHKHLERSFLKPIVVY